MAVAIMPALEGDYAIDPLEIALSCLVNEGEVWIRAESRKPHAELYILGAPARGFVLDHDLGGGFRSCVRFDEIGRELLHVEGRRQGECELEVGKLLDKLERTVRKGGGEVEGNRVSVDVHCAADIDVHPVHAVERHPPGPADLVPVLGEPSANDSDPRALSSGGEVRL
jgi:hypothetical protein